MEHYCNIFDFINKNFYSLLFDFITTFVGAFLGFVFAWLIYKHSNKKATEVQVRTEIQKYYNTLKRFSLLLDSVVDKSRKQNLDFERYSEEQKNNPLNLFIRPGLYVSNDRDRLVKSDNSDLYNAFMYFDKDNENKNKDYLNMFIYADFIEKYYTDLFLQDAKHLEYAFNDFKTISDNLLRIINILNLIQIQKETELGDNAKNNSEYLFVQRYIDLHVKFKGTGFADFQLYFDNFFRPLLNEMNDNIQLIDNKFRIGIELSSALTLLENRRLNSISHSEEFSNKQKIENIEKSLSGLEKINEKIKKINEP